MGYQRANQVLQEIVVGDTVLANFGSAIALPIYGAVVLGLATLTLREES